MPRLNRPVHIARELPCGLESLGRTDVALDDKALVELHQVGDPFVNKKVVSDSHLRNGQFVANHAEIQERSVEDYVAVVRDEHVGLARDNVFSAAEAYAVGSCGGEHFEERPHHLRLKIILSLDSQEIADKPGIVDIGHHVSHGMFEAGLAHQSGDFLVEFVVVIRRNVAELLRDVRKGRACAVGGECGIYVSHHAVQSIIEGRIGLQSYYFFLIYENPRRLADGGHREQRPEAQCPRYQS